jgi:hypothetical protein
MLGGMALLAPLRSQGRHTVSIGVLHHDPHQDPAVKSMFKRLAQLGWVEGRDLGVEYHEGLAPDIQAMFV